LIAGNWKMYKTVNEAEAFIDEFLPLVSGLENIEIVICPPFTCLPALQQRLLGTLVKLGAQDVGWENQGAYTGEISPLMLTDLGCKYVIVGHSERRQWYGEDDRLLNRKLRAASAAGLIPVLCVGETQTERQNKLAQQVVRQQLHLGLQGLKPFELVVAYEPVWAIGTGLNANPEDAQEMASFIRVELGNHYDNSWAENIRILYGGSVKPDNIAHFIGEADIDGALVGGASLMAADFARIARLNNHV